MEWGGGGPWRVEQVYRAANRRKGSEESLPAILNAFIGLYSAFCKDKQFERKEISNITWHVAFLIDAFTKAVTSAGQSHYNAENALPSLKEDCKGSHIGTEKDPSQILSQSGILEIRLDEMTEICNLVGIHLQRSAMLLS